MKPTQPASPFKPVLKWLLSIEGGYVNDPSDRGGETNFGISKRAYPDLDIANLAKEQAAAIYFRDYWLKAGCDQFPPILAWALFGGAVHHGPERAIQLMQQSLRVTADGDNGPKTQAAAASAEQYATLINYCSRRAQFMVDITIANSTQARFLRGWFKRLFSLQQAIILEYPA